MDSRVPTTTANNGRHYVFGRSFESAEAAEQFAEQTIARRERIAGRPLTAKELAHGILRADDRIAMQKIEDANWRPTISTPEQEKNPITRMREAGGLNTGPRKKETRKEMWARVEGEVQARLDGDAPPDPQRQRAIDLAEAQLEVAQFDPAASYRDVERARQTLRQAREGDIATAKTMLDAGRAASGQRHDARVQARDAEVAALRAERANIVGEEFDPAPAAPKVRTFYPSTYIGPVSPEERERANREYLEGAR